jgi:hypothetical protein
VDLEASLVTIHFSSISYFESLLVTLKGKFADCLDFDQLF